MLTNANSLLLKHLFIANICNLRKYIILKKYNRQEVSCKCSMGNLINYFRFCIWINLKPKFLSDLKKTINVALVYFLVKLQWDFMWFWFVASLDTSKQNLFSNFFTAKAYFLSNLTCLVVNVRT